MACRPIWLTSSISSPTVRIIWAWSTTFWKVWSTSSASALCRARIAILDFRLQPLRHLLKACDWALKRLVEIDPFHPRHRHPHRLAGIGIDDDVGRCGPGLLAGIEHPCLIDAISPRAVFDEWRLMNMAGKNQIGFEAPDPIRQFGIAIKFPPVPAGR